MKILPAHRNFIIINQVILATVFNFFVNIGIAWFLYRDADQVSLWGQGGIAMDTVLTSFILTLLSFYYIVLSVWFTMKMNWLPVITGTPIAGVVTTMMRTNIIMQGIIFAVLATACIGLPVIYGLFLTGTYSMSYESFRWYKAIFGAVLSIIVSPPMGLLAIMDFSIRKKLIK